MRRFEKVSKYQNEDFELPVRATNQSAGYDFASIEDLIVQPKEIVLVKTGVRVKMPKNEVLLLFPRSSLPIKKGLTMSNGVGVIDADYYFADNEGHIMIQIYNFTDKPVTIEKGERLSQGIFTNFYQTVDDETEDKIRLGGFGSTNL